MIEIKRILYGSSVIGILTYKNLRCFTLELPDLNNEVNISCIPEGIYKAKKRFSPSKQCEVIEYIDVPNRTYIQIHSGNYTNQLLGCQAVGDAVKFIDNDDILDVSNSKSTFEKLMSLLPGEIDIKVYSE